MDMDMETGMDMNTDFSTDTDTATDVATDIMHGHGHDIDMNIPFLDKVWMPDIVYREKFNPISNIMLDSALCSPMAEIPISGSVRYRSSRISDCCTNFFSSLPKGNKKNLFHLLEVTAIRVLSNIWLLSRFSTQSVFIFHTKENLWQMLGENRHICQ